MAKSAELRALEKQTRFIRKALDAQMLKLEHEPLAVEYDNGGGQSGIRENPEWTAYEKLLKSYHASLRAIAAQNGTAKEKTSGIGSPLNNFRDKYGTLKVVKDA